MSREVSWALVSWWPHSRRSEMFATTLGGKLHCIHYLQPRKRLHVPFKYALQGIHTLGVLFRQRPQAVHVQNPPFICSLVVYSYCRVAGAQFVIDHHSAAFSRAWKWALPIQKLLARRAVTNIVTNRHWADIVHSWDAHALIMGDPFLALPRGGTFPVTQGFNIAFVCTFAPDEPVDAVLEAAARLPDVHFYFTGDTRQKPQSLGGTLPANVTCTGFLPDAQYIALLRAVDGILVLTKRDHTLQLGGCEAVSVGQPLIISNWPFLRECFPSGTIHVDNSPGGIREGILAMQKERQRLKEEMLLFRSTARHKWDIQLSQLKQTVAKTLYG